jgi:hypothetical protein
MSKYRKADLSGIKTIKFDSRNTKLNDSEFGSPFDPDSGFGDFLESFPGILRAKDLLDLSERIAAAAHGNKAVIWMMGAHPLKVGLAPVINDLVARGFVSHLAVTGAFVIHDLELAFYGRTSEEVAEGLTDGSFGMVEETPRLLFEAARLSGEKKLGFGEGVGGYITERKPKFKRQSVLSGCYEKSVPVSVHIAIGTDTISQHPDFDGSLLGGLSNTDFLIFCESIADLTRGVILNFGSAVILPEVFLKALTVARNLHGGIDRFTAANFDMIQHYRPNMNVVTRPVADSGTGYSITGHHELMLPLLAAAVKYRFKKMSGES